MTNLSSQTTRPSWAAPVIMELPVDLTAIAGGNGVLCQFGTLDKSGTPQGVCVSPS